MTWIAVQTKDWLKEKEAFSPIQAYMYLVAIEKKGKIKSDTLMLASLWTCTEQKVVKYLDQFKEKGLLVYTKEKKDLLIEFVNYENIPKVTHQMAVPKKQMRLIKNIEGRLPQKDVLTRDENIATWIWRQIKLVNPSSRVIDSAFLEEWADDIQLMRKMDGRTDDQIVEVVKWALKNEFWSGVIKATSGLRRNFEKILSAMESDGRPKKIEEKVERAVKGNYKNSTDPV